MHVSGVAFRRTTVSVLFVWLCCQVFLTAGQIINVEQTDDPFLYTHPETCLPLASGLINSVSIIQASRNATASTNERKDRSLGRVFSDFGLGRRNPCSRFINLMFRSHDGSCNNQDTRGKSVAPLARLLPAQYSDGMEAPRRFSVTGPNVPLPSPRTVSRTVHPDRIDSSDLTIYVMQWGQFMDHEMVSTPLPVEDTRGTVQCCGPNSGPPIGAESSECFPILFPPGDPDFQGTCMEFVRSQPANDSDGNRIMPRENQNIVTAFIDASTVYGSTPERLEEVRDPVKTYLLRTTADNFLPDNGLDDCVKRDANDICFLAGDERVNEQPGLTLMHTIFVRYHNFVATKLRECSPFESEEFIFEQARAVVVAVEQKILYTDWLPIALGPSVRSEFDLDIEPGVRTVHDPDVDPRILQGFSTACFRFGHTLIPRSLPLSPSRRVLLRELFFKPFETRENLDTLADGLARATDDEDRTQPGDRFIVEEVTSRLFENQEGPRRGFDLVSLNLQRGRDHGLPGYNDFREELGLPRVTSFSDSALGTAGTDLSTVYDHVDDIDLFAGAMSEPAFDGGLVGETFSRLMATQLNRLKFGDRFFYNNQRNFFGFTNRQLAVLRQISLADILCLTTGITEIQPDVFRIPGPGNRRGSCESRRREHPPLEDFARFPL